MKILNKKEVNGGKVRINIELNKDEFLKVIRKDAFYKLGAQIDEVVATHAIEESTEVSWCSVSQEWVES